MCKLYKTWCNCIIVIAILGILTGCGISTYQKLFGVRGDFGYRILDQKVIFSIWDGSRQVDYVIDNADPDTFKVLFDHEYAIDQHHVYKKQNSIPYADPPSFELLSRWHAVDRKHGFHNGELIAGSDPGTFQELNSSFSKDRRDVYIGGSGIGACDSSTFELLLNFWGKDRECAYNGFNIVKGADVDSFEALSRYYAKDNKFVYVSTGRKLKNAEIEELPNSVRKRVHSGGWLSVVVRLEKVDVQTFEVIPEQDIYARDGNKCYKFQKSIRCSEIDREC